MTASPTGLAVRASTWMASAAIVTSMALPHLVDRAALPILLVGVLLGLPHGAVDHLVPFRTGRVRAGGRRMLVVLLAYVAVAALAWTGLTFASRFVLPLLLVVSVLHFGFGDLAAGAGVVPGSVSGWSPVEAVARGGWVVAGPLLAWPATTTALLAAVGGGAPAPGPRARLVVVAVVVICSVVVVCRAARRRDLAGAVDVGLLALLFLVVTPLAAFGVYFGTWHALRHTARLLETDPQSERVVGGDVAWRPALARFVRQAALPTTVALLGGLGVVVFANGHRAVVGGAFAVLLALTVPHLVAVALLDRSETSRKRFGVAVA